MHTLAIHIYRNRVASLFERHTADLSPAQLGSLFSALVDGTIAAERGLSARDHGALVLHPVPDGMPFLAVTGPNCNLVCGLRYRPYFAMPYGEARAAGCWGLIHAYAALHPECASQVYAALASSPRVLPD
jgi:hypothetical protein